MKGKIYKVEDLSERKYIGNEQFLLDERFERLAEAIVDLSERLAELEKEFEKCSKK